MALKFFIFFSVNKKTYVITVVYETDLSEFEVIQAVILKQEPASLPGLVAATYKQNQYHVNAHIYTSIIKKYTKIQE